MQLISEQALPYPFQTVVTEMSHNQFFSRWILHVTYVIHNKTDGSKSIMPKLVNAYYLIFKTCKIKSEQKTEEKTYLITCNCTTIHPANGKDQWLA